MWKLKTMILELQNDTLGSKCSQQWDLRTYTVLKGPMYREQYRPRVCEKEVLRKYTDLRERK
jgi:hypothetical protein